MSNNAKNLPEVKLGQYKGLAVTRHVRPLSEKTIDQEMVHQTRMRSVYHNSTAPAKRGSRVLLDFVGFMDGEEIPDSRMEKVMVVLGDGKLMPAAEDAIYGHTAGETFRFDFTYPEQFRVEELSGKTAQFEIKLHSVAEKTTPELNEEFARAQGYADLAAMREAVRAKKRKIHEDAADRAAGQELLAKAGANLTVDLPEAMLDRTADNEMRMLEQRLSRSNITLEKHCKNSHTTAAALRAGYRDAAERNLRSMLASRSIAEAENITVSTLEVNNEYRRLSQLQDTPEADIRRVLSPDTLAAALVAQKVQRFLLDNADIASSAGPCIPTAPPARPARTSAPMAMRSSPAPTSSRTGIPAPTAACVFRPAGRAALPPRRSRCSGTSPLPTAMATPSGSAVKDPPAKTPWCAPASRPIRGKRWPTLP